MNYLYEGHLTLRIPFILALSLLECGLVCGIRRFMPEINKIRLSVYDIVLAAAIVIPFLYIRTIVGQSLSQDNKLEQILMTVCCLIAVITLAAEIAIAASEAIDGTVMCALRKDVRKGNVPGQAVVSEYKTIRVNKISEKAVSALENARKISLK
jgi:hypothetical protein